MGRLTGYFDEKLRQPLDLAVSPLMSLSDIGSGSQDDANAVISASYDIDNVVYRVNYSDFVNFVFFNSALDYFNISGERILNEYPIAGTQAEMYAFLSKSDDYQKWLLKDSWPAGNGNYGSISASASTIDAQAILNPSTGSFTVEAWTDGGAYDLSASATGTIFKVSSGSDYIHVYYTSPTSTIHFDVFSSGALNAVSMSFDSTNSGSYRYISCVADRDAGLLKIIHAPHEDFIDKYHVSIPGYLSTYPTGVCVIASSSMSFPPSFSFTNGSSIVVTSGAICTNVSFWKTARTIEQVKYSYAGKIYNQDGLAALWRFNQSIPTQKGWLFRDCSVNGLDLYGNVPLESYIKRDGTSMTGSLSMLRAPYDVYDPITSFMQDGLVESYLEDYVSEQQTSGSLHDRNNTNIITALVPEQYLILEENIGTEVLKKFLYVMARQFDQIKVAIDQFAYFNKVNWTKYNQTPDALLEQAGKFYGWDFVGNFLDHDAIKYLFGKNVIPGADLDVKLFDIKNEFWRRTLLELMHIYKTKGTRESVESLMRVYGLDSRIIKLKEYGVKPEAQITTSRINAHKSLPMFRVRSNEFGVAGQDDHIESNEFVVSAGYSYEAHVKFNDSEKQDGDIVIISDAAAGYEGLKVINASGSKTGSLVLYKSSGSSVTIPDLPIFDGGYYNIYVSAPMSGNFVSSSYNGGTSQLLAFEMGGGTGSGDYGWQTSIVITRLDEDVISKSWFYTVSTASCLVPSTMSLKVGHSASVIGEYLINEFKFYKNYELQVSEMISHTYDPQSYGVTSISDFTSSFAVHYKFDDDFIAWDNAPMYVFNHADQLNSGSVLLSGTNPCYSTDNGYNPFEHVLIDYNFIATPEYGWNEDKIRVLSGTKISNTDKFASANALALEFNLVDALNEDISKMLATMDNWNNVIGVPANKFRDSYPDLDQYRKYYFNRLTGRVNFRKFAEMLQFFDRSFIKMLQKLLPARAVFYGEEFIIESHMLERPKVQWTYRRRNPEFLPEGRIAMIEREDNSTIQPYTKIYQ